MLPKPVVEEDEKDAYTGLTQQKLDEWRQDGVQRQQWMWDAQVDADYKDGNQFTEEDRQAMAANGIPMVTINRVKHQIESVIGLQRTNLTDLKLSAEDPQAQDAIDALNVKVHEAERTSKMRESRLAAQATAATVGIGWVEIGRNPNPFKPGIKTAEVPWREMYWDWRNGNDIDDWEFTRRVKAYPVERLQAAFQDKKDEIEAAGWSQSNFMQWVDVDQNYRQYDGRNWRDVPLTWNWSPESQKRFRMLEEVFYQVQVEGVIVRLPSGRVIAWEDCCNNPMIQLAVKTGNAELEEACYGRWRRSYWINQVKLRDEWSPLPFNDNPYTPIWCYREDQTGVPYGLVRVMRSIQDAINTLEAKMMFSINAKQVIFEENSIDAATWQQNIGRKNAMLPVRSGFLEKVKVNDHIALNEQHFKLYQDLLVQIEAVGGTAGLNAAAMGQKPRSAVLAQQLMMQSMSALGGFQSNCSDAAVRLGYQLAEMVKEDIEKRGNVNVEVQDAGGKKRRIMLHKKGQMYEHDGEQHQIVDNDVTLLNTQMALEEVPHTATYRAGQLDNLAIALQSLPPNDPQLTKVRLILTAKMLECSDIPGAQADAQLIRESIGLAPPETPEEIQAAQQAAQKAQQQEQLQLEDAQATIRQKNATSTEKEAKAQHHLVLAQAEGQPDPMEQQERALGLEKTAQQVHQIAAKTQHTLAQTSATHQKAAGQAISNAKEVLPEQGPPGW